MNTPTRDPGGVLVMREPGGEWDAPACKCTGSWHPQCCYGARVHGVMHLRCCGTQVVAPSTPRS